MNFHLNGVLLYTNYVAFWEDIEADIREDIRIRGIWLDQRDARIFEYLRTETHHSTFPSLFGLVKVIFGLHRRFKQNPNDVLPAI